MRLPATLFLAAAACVALPAQAGLLYTYDAPITWWAPDTGTYPTHVPANPAIHLEFTTAAALPAYGVWTDATALVTSWRFGDGTSFDNLDSRTATNGFDLVTETVGTQLYLSWSVSGAVTLPDFPNNKATRWNWNNGLFDQGRLDTDVPWTGNGYATTRVEGITNTASSAHHWQRSSISGNSLFDTAGVPPATVPEPASAGLALAALLAAYAPARRLRGRRASARS